MSKSSVLTFFKVTSKYFLFHVTKLKFNIESRCSVCTSAMSNEILPEKINNEIRNCIEEHIKIFCAKLFSLFFFVFEGMDYLFYAYFIFQCLVQLPKAHIMYSILIIIFITKLVHDYWCTSLSSSDEISFLLFHNIIIKNGSNDIIIINDVIANEQG